MHIIVYVRSSIACGALIIEGNILTTIWGSTSVHTNMAWTNLLVIRVSTTLSLYTVHPNNHGIVRRPIIHTTGHCPTFNTNGRLSTFP